MLETFDLPQMNPSCMERTPSTVVTQPLHLLNNAFVHDLAGSFAERIMAAEESADERIRLGYRLALSRLPSESEMKTSRKALAALNRYRERVETEAEKSPERLAMTDFCHTLLNSAAFLYID